MIPFVVGGLVYFWWQNSYTIVIPKQSITCLPHKVFFREKTKQWERGQLVTFQLHKDIIPYFKKGEGFLKIAAAIPGDRVKITKSQVIVSPTQGDDIIYDTSVDYVLNNTDHTLNEVTRVFTVPEGKFFALGTTYQSYDSRYWGVANINTISGVAYAIF